MNRLDFSFNSTLSEDEVSQKIVSGSPISKPNNSPDDIHGSAENASCKEM